MTTSSVSLLSQVSGWGNIQEAQVALKEGNTKKALQETSNACFKIGAIALTILLAATYTTQETPAEKFTPHPGLDKLFVLPNQTKTEETPQSDYSWLHLFLAEPFVTIQNSPKTTVTSSVGLAGLSKKIIQYAFPSPKVTFGQATFIEPSKWAHEYLEIKKADFRQLKTDRAQLQAEQSTFYFKIFKPSIALSLVKEGILPENYQTEIYTKRISPLLSPLVSFDRIFNVGLTPLLIQFGALPSEYYKTKITGAPPLTKPFLKTARYFNIVMDELKQHTSPHRFPH